MFHMEQFKQKFKLVWHNAPDLIFFWIFVFVLPFGTRRILATLVPYSATTFNEWTSVFLYGTDILVILIIFFWIRRLVRFHQSFAKYGRALNIAVLALIIIALGSAVISPFTGLGLYGAVKLIEFGLIFLYCVYNIVTYRRRLLTAVMIFAAGGIQALIAIAQFISQGSLGLSILGESKLGTYLPNVAEVIYAGEPILRSYGTLPHPNVLGYFLMVSLVMGFYVFWRIREPYFRLTLAFLAGLEFLALLLSFSRVAWLALGVGGAVSIAVYFWMRRRRGQQSLWSLLWGNLKIPVVRVSLVLFLVMILGSILVLLPLLNNRLTISDTDGDMAVSFRSYLNEKALSFTVANPAVGWGPKSFVPLLTATGRGTIPEWAKQPVHNVWLGLMAEVGLLGVLAFLGLIIIRTIQLCKNQKTVPRGTVSGISDDLLLRSLIIGLIAGSILIMFFDHYILDVQQGSLLFFLVLGL